MRPRYKATVAFRLELILCVLRVVPNGRLTTRKCTERSPPPFSLTSVGFMGQDSEPEPLEPQTKKVKALPAFWFLVYDRCALFHAVETRNRLGYARSRESDLRWVHGTGP